MDFDVKFKLQREGEEISRQQVNTATWEGW